MERKYLTTDLLIIGGGTAGCYAAITAARQARDLRILIAEKANIKRSGCLAAGVNALNAYITEGQTVRDYLEFVRWDAEKIIRDDLVLSMAGGFNETAADLERMGLVILKDERGKYVTRGRQNIKINGENIKPLLAAEVGRYGNIEVLNHINITDYLTAEGRVFGAVGFGVEEEIEYGISARAVLIATGGAAGLYRPNNPGFSRHKMWYPPFNTGAGYAMGIRAGAEMTSFEMRFVAQRCKDTIAPTGTIALGVGAREVNARGEIYEKQYGLSTSGRAYGTTNETYEGRGPCYLRTKGITSEQDEELLAALEKAFPGTVREGRLDRKALGRIVFTDAAKLAELNRITHRFVTRAVDARLREYAMQGGRLAAIDAVELISSGLAEKCAAVVGILAEREKRIERIMRRPLQLAARQAAPAPSQDDYDTLLTAFAMKGEA